jgi:RNA polymerase sigma-70 factor (ECF subfamily)
MSEPSRRRVDPRRRDVMIDAMSACSTTDDDAAGGRASAASPAALEVLVANHARFLAFLQRRVGSRDLAEEILQDAFVRGLSRGPAGRLRDDESAVAWFYRLLRNAIVDRARRASAERRALARAVTLAVDEPQDDAELVETICACVRSLVETLPPAHARAIRRVELGGVSAREFAEEEGITPGHAAVRLHRARQALRKRIEQSCGTCATHGCYQCECRNEPHPGAPAAGAGPAQGSRPTTGDVPG